MQRKACKSRVFFAFVATAWMAWQYSLSASTAVERSYDTLTIGTQTYSNVTVTTKNKDYVFFLHSGGMMNVKVAELSGEEKEMLGYEPKKPATNAAIAWTKTTLKKIDTSQVKAIEERLQASAPPDVAKLFKQAGIIPMLAGFCALVLGIYLFVSYCCMLICKKAGTEPGALVWIPILQMLPLLRAAGMSPLWFLATLLPVLNVIAHLVWCIKITQARGKGFWTAIFLILPVTNLLAFLYLAFSNGSEPQEDKRGRIQIMTLETA